MNIFGKHNTNPTLDNIVLLLNNEQMRVYCWLEDSFTSIGTFVETEQSIEDFVNCLLQFPGIPITLVIDYFGENFRHETIAHVNSRDRKAILKRKLNTYFNNTEFKHANIFDSVKGQIKGARKEDKVLYSALANTDMFVPWLDKMAEHKMVIRSISSATFLMEDLCRFEELESVTNLLVVNVEPDGSFRQTFLQNGVALFSRANPLLTDSPAEIADIISTQCTQSKAYLERIKLMAMNSNLKVCIFSPYKSTQGFSFDSRDAEGIHYNEYFLSSEAARSNLPFYENQTGVIELTLARVFSRVKGLKNIYAPPIVRRYAILNDYIKMLRVASYGVMAMTLILLLPLFHQGYEILGLKKHLYQRIEVSRDEFLYTQENTIDSLIDPAQMQLVVDNYQTISAQLESPLTMIALLSEALTANPGIDLSTFQWQLSPSQDDQKELVPALLSESTQVSSVLSGSVFFDGSYQLAQAQVQSLIQSLEILPGITVEPILMPMDTSAKSAVKVTVDDDVNRTNFSLQLVYESHYEI